MAVKLEWQEPTNQNVLTLEISRATTKFGSYSIIEATLNATSDGDAKSSSNTWVTSYIDSSGTKDHWYKIRFYDDVESLFSDYSEPVTGQQEIKLCSVDEVKKVINTVGRFTDDEIFDAIIEVEEEIYVETGTPISSMWSNIGKNRAGVIQDTYYVGEENIHRIDRVFYGTTTKYEYFLDDGYKTNLPYGMVRLLSVASGGPELNTQCDIEIRYVPKIYNRIAIYRVAKFLLEQVDYAIDGKTSKKLEVIEKRLKNLERILNERVAFMLSSAYKNYDPIYGVNRKKITQDFDRNKYIASTGW